MRSKDEKGVRYVTGDIKIVKYVMRDILVKEKILCLRILRNA